MENGKSENICFTVYLIRGQNSKQNMEKQQWGVRFQLDSERQGRWTPFISCSFSFISVQPWLSVFVTLTTVCVLLLSLRPLKPVLDMCLCCDLRMSIMIICTHVDLDECVQGQHPCQQRCVNTFGSFKCSCDDGYRPAHDQTSCTGVCACVPLCLFMSCTSMHKAFYFNALRLSRRGWVPAACSCNRLCVWLC